MERFEEKAYPVGESTPAETLAFLLEQRGLKPIALKDILGSRGRVSEALSGKRSIIFSYLGERVHIVIVVVGVGKKGTGAKVRKGGEMRPVPILRAGLTPSDL